MESSGHDTQTGALAGGSGESHSTKNINGVDYDDQTEGPGEGDGNEENIYDTVSYDHEALFEQWKNQGSLISKQAKVIRRACRNQNYYFIPRIFILLAIGAAAAATFHVLCKKYGVLSKFPLINAGFAFFAATFVSCLIFGVVENIRHKYFQKEGFRERWGGNYFSSRNILVLTTGLSFAFLYHFLSEAGKMPLFSHNPLVNLGFAFILTSLTFYFISSMAGNIANHLYSKEAQSMYLEVSSQDEGRKERWNNKFDEEFFMLESFEKYREHYGNDDALANQICTLNNDENDIIEKYNELKRAVKNQKEREKHIMSDQSKLIRVDEYSTKLSDKIHRNGVKGRLCYSILDGVASEDDQELQQSMKKYIDMHNSIQVDQDEVKRMFQNFKRYCKDTHYNYCSNDHWYDFYSRQNIPSKVEDVEIAFSNPLTMITTPVLYCIDKYSSKGDSFGDYQRIA